MEVTTVSPSAISPTEGDDLCEIDVTNVAIHSVTLLIGLCGLAGNGALLCLFTLKWRITSIIALAVTDFLFLLFTVPSSLLFLLEDMSCSPIRYLVYLRLLFQLSMVSYFCPLFGVEFPSIRKDMTFLCSLCFHCHLNGVMWRALFFVFFAVIIFFPLMTFLCVSPEQGYCQAPLISMYTLMLLLFAAPVVISCTIHLIEAKWGSQQQQPKRLDIFLILLFTLPLSLCDFLQKLGYIVVSSQVVFLLPCINSNIKPFICFLVGSPWRPCSIGGCWRHCTVGSLRDSLRRVFEEPEENTPRSNDASMDTVI